MVKKSKPFTGTEQRVIRAMFWLGRWATANEIAIQADRMSWNTAINVLRRLYSRGIVRKKQINGKRHWAMRRDF